jgi:uncharacterized phage protein gp47/JayE
VLFRSVPKGTIYARADGFEYITLEEIVVVPGAGIYAQAKARTPGALGNCPDDTTLMLQKSIPGLGVYAEPSGSVGFTGGVDAETIPALRTRLLAILAEPAGGGKKGDYVRWAKMVPGVTRAWEFGNVPKVGNVTVLFMRDGDDTPFPNLEARAAVVDMLTLFAPIALPAPALSTVLSPIEHPLTLEIQLTIEDDAVASDVRDRIVQAIRDMLATRVAPPAVAGTVLYRSWISEVISTTLGEKDHKLLAPLDDVVLGQWELPTLADPVAQITWS